jgi:AcrR family transcriptional regulator
MAGRTKTHNQQIENSRACIVEALFRRMKKISYNKISVSDIIKKAGVSRQTFYRHYKNKDDVIFQFLEGCFAPSMHEKTNPPILDEYQNTGYVYLMSLPLKKIVRYAEALKIILNSDAEYLVYQYEGKWKADRLHLFNLTSDLISRENIYLRYTTFFSMTGSTQVICDWIKNDMPIPVEELIEWLREKNRSLVNKLA